MRDLPKAMASVGGRPFLAYVLEHLRSQYLRQVVLAIGYRGEAIREYFRAGEDFGLQIAYSDEGNRKLGTGGALARALQTYGGRRPRYVVVSNGDTYLSFDLEELMEANQARSARILLAAASVPDVARYGGLELGPNREVLSFQEKGRHGPGIVNAGTYLTTPQALELLMPMRERFSFEHEVLRPLAGNGLYAQVVDGSFVDIGVPDDYRTARRILAAGPQGDV